MSTKGSGPRPGSPKWKAAQKKLFDVWQSMPDGTAVIVRRDDGTDFHTHTRSEPWLLGHGAAVIKVSGITGCYLLDRISIDASATPPTGDPAATPTTKGEP